MQRPLAGFAVQAKRTNEDIYHSITEVGADVTFVTVAGLLPGMSHDIRVLATNGVGGTPSDVIVIVTEATSKCGCQPHFLYVYVCVLTKINDADFLSISCSS